MLANDYEIFQVKPDLQRVKFMAGIGSILLIVAGNLVYTAIWQYVSFRISVGGVFLFFGLLFSGGLLHEVVHVVGFLRFTEAGKKDIHMGLNHYMPFVHCRRPVNLRGFRWAILLPTVLTGLVPLGLGIGLQSLLITNVSCLLTAGGIGDLIGFIYLVRYPGNALVYDYPDQLGCDVYVPRG